MINNDSENTLLNTTVGKVIATSLRNPFDKKICSLCKSCNQKNDIKHYCGVWRKEVAVDGSCDSFKTKE